jgi:hypothetical protein
MCTLLNIATDLLRRLCFCVHISSLLSCPIYWLLRSSTRIKIIRCNQWPIRSQSNSVFPFIMPSWKCADRMQSTFGRAAETRSHVTADSPEDKVDFVRQFLSTSLSLLHTTTHPKCRNTSILFDLRLSLLVGSVGSCHPSHAAYITSTPFHQPWSWLFLTTQAQNLLTHPNTPDTPLFRLSSSSWQLF